jgi:hypothetical protein
VAADPSRGRLARGREGESALSSAAAPAELERRRTEGTEVNVRGRCTDDEDAVVR